MTVGLPFLFVFCFVVSGDSDIFFIYKIPAVFY